MDLFTPVVDQSKLHPGFTKIACARNRYALDVLIDWSRGFQDRDGKFVQEFQTSFESSFWELYLHALLKCFRLIVDFQQNRPDFVVVDPVQFSIEATVAHNDTRSVPAHSPTHSDIPQDLNAFNNEAIVRLSNSFASKLAKYKASYSTLAHVAGKPFVLALAPFDRAFAHLEVQRPIETLLFGYYVNEVDFIKNGDFSEQPRRQQVERVIKHNGTPIDVGLFNSDVAKEISAIIYNSTATWGKVLALSSDPQSQSIFTAVSLNTGGVLPHKVTLPKTSYAEHLIDGLRVYHNPHAEYPLSPQIFRDRRVFQAYWDDAANKYVYEQHDGQLLFRTVTTLVHER